MKRLRGLRKSPAVLAILTYLLLGCVIVVAHFPYDTGGANQTVDSRKFYDSAYSPEDQQRYTKVAEDAAKLYRITERVTTFAHDYHLENKKVLDVGAGRGYLQDVVSDYTGLDISSSAARYFHKRFVLGSATNMPLSDNEFDAAWSIWTLEHVPDPERMLEEMRRVLKPGGLLYLFPAWDVPSWASQGYDVRPYSDFGVGGKLTKASLVIQASPLFQLAYKIPIRSLRYLASKSGPTHFHYRRLQPNYERYWEPDSDAVNSMDAYETSLWFESRGDRCLNCDGLLNTGDALILQVKPKRDDYTQF
jgi:ubiquinone/menaquinone biosynthesis C-methylase UbiE